MDFQGNPVGILIEMALNQFGGNRSLFYWYWVFPTLSFIRVFLQVFQQVYNFLFFLNFRVFINSLHIFCQTYSFFNIFFIWLCRVLVEACRLILLLMNLFWAVLCLCCCTQAFSSCGEWGLLFVGMLGLLIAVASLVKEHRLQGLRASVVAAHGLSTQA